jgi:hypothetical protein
VALVYVMSLCEIHHYANNKRRTYVADRAKCHNEVGPKVPPERSKWQLRIVTTGALSFVGLAAAHRRNMVVSGGISRNSDASD